MFENTFHDLRYALHSLRAAPAFAATAILSLALGIGANTAIFSLINAVILKPLPVRAPAELVELSLATPDGHAFPNPVWEQLRDRQEIFAGAFAYSPIRLNLAPGGEVRPANTHWVSGAYFSTLGVAPHLGRTLTPADDRRGCPATAVLSYDFWQREYGGAPDVLTRPLTLETHPVRILGVAPPGFTGVHVGEPVDLFLPLCAEGTLIRENSALDKRGNSWLWIFARRKPELSQPLALARLNALAPAIFADTLPPNLPPAERTTRLNRRFTLLPGAQGYSNLRRDYQAALYTLMAAVGMVLLIACANVANLLLSRAALRGREMAIRLALGASRPRLIRQLLTESLLLAALGAALGVLFAQWAGRLLVGYLTTATAPVALDLAIDLRVLAFTLAAALATGLLFGLAPAWRGSRIDPHAAMKANARGAVGAPPGLPLGKLLVALQVAVSLVLLIGAGLMVGTFSRLAALDPGFDRGQVLLVRVDPRRANIPPERRLALYQELQRRLTGLAGVRSASYADITPVSGSSSYQTIETAPGRGEATVWINSIGPGYFATLDTHILAGRDFDAHDTAQAPPVAVVNESTAHKFYGSAAGALGKTFRQSGTTVEIIGVVSDTKYRSLRADREAIVYYPLSQLPPMRWANFLIRANGPAAGLVSGVKAEVEALNTAIALQFRTLEGQVEESLGRERLLATLTGFFGLLALALAVIGLYGVVSHNIARRRGEIGIRMALGAARGRVLGMVLGEAAILVGAGLTLGLGAATLATRLLKGFLYGLQPNDPATLTAACATLATAALLAGLLPARRAANLDPMAALREE